MTETIPLKQQAQGGDPQAIATLMNRSFNRRGVTAFVTTKGNCLQILLESSVVPSQSTFVSMIWMGVHKLEIPNIHSLEIYGKQLGNEIPSWSQKVTLDKAIVDQQYQEDTMHTHLNTNSIKENSDLRVTPLKDISKVLPVEPPKNIDKNLDIKNTGDVSKSHFLHQLLGRFNIRSAAYGFLMDVIGSECSSFLLTMIFSFILAMQGKNYYQIQTELSNNYFSIIYASLGLLFSGAGGFLAAHCAKHDRILNSALAGVISTSFGCLMTYTNPQSIPPSSLQTMSLLLTIPVAIAGGCIRQASLKKQMRTI
ncbi:YrzE family protein [Pseudanabaena sp. FACHB-1998]|uniref:YrzE family protein n=1 Tax=Pseudanabaena sp. FACHB-1998 TaxID=2692858 RepID=UPI001680719B|nr:YrzE family protein [Pseudanabaena sp. FACHB-1998]MBD2179330.1 YrzE family protein [Pseudanabaena sp. FACHB-1998]